ncbi:hypothetical protein D3C75_1381330 [compost metagenome]
MDVSVTTKSRMETNMNERIVEIQLLILANKVDVSIKLMMERMNARIERITNT